MTLPKRLFGINRLPDIIKYFEDLPPAQINPGEGTWTEQCGSCVGAHLARIFELNTNRMSDYEYGRMALAYNLSISESELETRLTAAGAPGFPFGTTWWEPPPQIVFRIFQKHLKKDREEKERWLRIRHELSTFEREKHDQSTT